MVHTILVLRMSAADSLALSCSLACSRLLAPAPARESESDAAEEEAAAAAATELRSEKEVPAP